MINNNKMVLSLKVDEKNYLLIKPDNIRCDDINQLMWMLLIRVHYCSRDFILYYMMVLYL